MGLTGLFSKRKAIELVNPSGFVNKKVSVSELVGKRVILVDFWTYSCINCMRTIPFLNAWYEKYHNAGLEIIGVHTPEFEFEKNFENVAKAVKKLGIKYPIVLDNDYGTWGAYNNRFWPAKYLTDIQGNIVFQHFGEGNYEETEEKIQELLRERSTVIGEKIEAQKEFSKPSNAETALQVGSPETYFGAARNDFLGNGFPGLRGAQVLVEPSEVKANELYLVGEWFFEKEYAENEGSEAKIIFKYRAKSVFLVASAEQKIFAIVERDGKNLDKEAGKDVTDSKVAVKEARLYRLVEDHAGFGEHVIEIIIEKPGLKAFTFTFG